nr:immunoglobulin light chain junction region [Macaca mulatta]
CQQHSKGPQRTF